jgi:hypothetical protein
MEKVVLAQIAYRAYGNWVEWKLPGGKPLPHFGQLPMYIQNAWTAACETVAIEVRKEVLSTQACTDESK